MPHILRTHVTHVNASRRIQLYVIVWFIHTIVWNVCIKHTFYTCSCMLHTHMTITYYCISCLQFLACICMRLYVLYMHLHGTYVWNTHFIHTLVRLIHSGQTRTIVSHVYNFLDTIVCLIRTFHTITYTISYIQWYVSYVHFIQVYSNHWEWVKTQWFFRIWTPNDWHSSFGPRRKKWIWASEMFGASMNESDLTCELVRSYLTWQRQECHVLIVSKVIVSRAYGRVISDISSHICTYVYVYIHVYTFKNIYICICICIYIYLFMYIYIHTYMYVDIYTNIHR